uniref:Oxysterol-binding protein-related protein 9 n=1 Tax=Cacopsylla melanoneura TaxID=428564 RepID=A0A8D8S5L2_9HEMI
MEGSLSKWTNVVKGWQYRWFVLDVNSGLLSYYTSREKMVRGVRRGCVRLKGAVIGIDDQDDSTFTITVDSKTFHFQAKNSVERETWVTYLQETILRHAYGIKSHAVNTLRLNHNPARVLPTLEEFDRNLAEADVYLQILINRCKILEDRMNSMTDEDRTKCDVILKDTLNMLEQVKHTIVLLQIAKNTAYPVNGSYQPTRRHSAGIDNQDFVNSLDMASEALDLGGFASIPSGSTIVPEISYSSSDEDDFFDAVSNDDYFDPKKRSGGDPSTTTTTTKKVKEVLKLFSFKKTQLNSSRFFFFFLRII